MSNISINTDIVAFRARDLKNASNLFDEQPLGGVDERTTISANNNAQNAFKEAQEGHRIFADALELSSTEIEAISRRFLILDSDAASRFHLQEK